MIQIEAAGELHSFPDGTRWIDAVRAFKVPVGGEALLVMIDGRIEELSAPARSGRIRFVTASEKPAVSAYQRSATLLMLRAFYAEAGEGNVEKISVDFSIGKGLFIEARGAFVLNEAFLSRVKERMRAYVQKDLPIVKRTIPTREAIERFARQGMMDKARLFKYRLVSSVNIYSLDGFEDYFYGSMLYSTGYIQSFDLLPYHHGFVLVLPDVMEPEKPAPFRPQEKLFSTLWESTKWGRSLDLDNVGGLNDMIVRDGPSHLVLVQEALQEKKIGEIAGAIAARPGVKLVMIAGPSSSGKTTFSHRLSIQLEALGLKPHPIAVDNYFVDRVLSPKDKDGNYDYESLACIDIEGFNHDMAALLRGEEVELPYYNFKKGMREYRGDYLRLGREDILVIEGIHCLNDALSHALPRESKFKIYISALTQLNIDEHNRIPTTDGRLLRRIVRDARTRGSGARETIRMWSSVRRGEESNIFPFQEEADVMFNSVLIYELAVLKQYAQPLLFGIPRDCPEYEEASRLLKFLDYFIGVSSEDVPKNSILREFIGGSCLEV